MLEWVIQCIKIVCDEVRDMEHRVIYPRPLKKDDCILKDEEITVFVDELAASAVIIGARAWVKSEDFWPTRWRLLEEIKLTLDARGIEIPYQQVTVHMSQQEPQR